MGGIRKTGLSTSFANFKLSRRLRNEVSAFAEELWYDNHRTLVLRYKKTRFQLQRQLQAKKRAASFWKRRSIFSMKRMISSKGKLRSSKKEHPRQPAPSTIAITSRMAIMSTWSLISRATGSTSTWTFFDEDKSLYYKWLPRVIFRIFRLFSEPHSTSLVQKSPRWLFWGFTLQLNRLI